MIFDAEALLGVVETLAAAEGVPTPVSITTLRATVAQAERLAEGRAEDEAAALFYACTRQARLFGKIADRLLDGVGGAQARRVGLELEANELDIVLLRGRIAFGAADWNEVRETFAGWLHPLANRRGVLLRSAHGRAEEPPRWPRRAASARPRLHLDPAGSGQKGRPSVR